VIPFTAAFVEREYNNRAACPDHPHWFAEYARRSALAYADLDVRRDLRYGPGERETLDLFLPRGRARGTFVFLHGGYWRALDKADFGFVAGPLVAAGIAVANVNYDLCPAVGVADIVEACARATAWVSRDGERHGAAASRVVVGGHSAGGHLAAMMVCTDWAARGFVAPPFHAAVSVSGVHDLTPLPRFSFNADLRLDEAGARALSPALLPVTVVLPLLVAAGAAETGEFVRQARLMWEAWPMHRPAGAKAPLIVPGRHHFSIVADFADPDSELTRATLALFD
jgi:arylformamidase